MKLIKIGRNSSENDVIINDYQVSKIHLQLFCDDHGSFFIIDLNSTNGTYVNGNRIPPAENIKLQPNDIIRIGSTVLPWRKYFSPQFENQAYSSQFELNDDTTGNDRKSGEYNLSHGTSDNPFDSKSAKQIYAGFWLRLAAYLMDTIIFTAAFVVLFFIVILLSTVLFQVTFNLEYLRIIIAIPVLVLQCLYFSLFESSEKQATIGKLIVGIQVVNYDGKRIQFGTALGRFFAKILSTLSLYIGFLMALWTDKKQTLHDKMTNTLVVIKQNKPTM